MAIKQWPTVSTRIFCPYCAKLVDKFRLSFDHRNEIIKCKNCQEEFGLLEVGVENQKDYLWLVLVSTNTENEVKLQNKVFCPFDGQGHYYKISEATAVDEDGDTDVDVFMQCNRCGRKVNLTIFDLNDPDSLNNWDTIKKEALELRT